MALSEPGAGKGGSGDEDDTGDGMLGFRARGGDPIESDIPDPPDASMVLHGGEDDDMLRGGGGADTITGGVGNDQIDAGGGDDDLDGGDGDDIIWAGAGDDLLRGDAATMSCMGRRGRQHPWRYGR